MVLGPLVVGAAMASAQADAPPPVAQPALQVQALTADDILVIAGRLLDAGRLAEAQALLDRLAADHTGGNERDFLDGMVALARKDYRRAEALFRRILAADPELLRVRLELARTLFLAHRDEQADYQFRLAIARHPPEAVLRNVARYREAIRARRSWRLDVQVGIAPDTNINAATSRTQVEVYGLPFQLSADSRAHSGIGLFASADASVRLWREARVPLYLGAYGRVLHYGDTRFDDVYLSGEAGPELRLARGRLRIAATGARRWYGGRLLADTLGGRLVFDKLLHGTTAIETSLALRHNAYAGRDDIDGWEIEGTLSANRALTPSLVGFSWIGIERTVAHDPGQSGWQGRLGIGALKEVRWGLRPQLSVEIARQSNDAPLAPFGTTRREWRLQAMASLYRRDWNVLGMAPSVRVTWTRDWSTIALYDQKRLRVELAATRAF